MVGGDSKAYPLRGCAEDDGDHAAPSVCWGFDHVSPASAFGELLLKSESFLNLFHFKLDEG